MPLRLRPSSFLPNLRFILILLVGILAFQTTQAHTQKKHPATVHRSAKTKNASLLWSIVKPGSQDTSYLFGTLHLLEQSYVDTLPHVIEDFEKSDVMIGEMVLDSSIKDELQSLMDTGVSLQSRLTADEYDTLSKAFSAALGLPIALFDSYEPIAVYALLLEGLYIKKHPENTQTKIPMDLYFQQRANAEGKKVMGLESLQDQSNALFDSIPESHQVKTLLDLVRHQDREIKQLDRLVRDYEAGKIEGLIHADDIEEMGAREADALIYQRNRHWIAELSEMLPHTKAFIAVGAGHLPGSKGLIAGLRKKGFRVEPVSIK